MKKYALIPLLALPMLAGNPSHADVEFPDPYCSISFGVVEPISRVILADMIDNSSDGGQSLEDFTRLHAVVNVGERYPITFEGDTAGAYINYFKVFIDWNHDSSFDESEVSVLDDYIYDSDGLDGQQATGFIDVPLTAVSGTTRVRVVKHYHLSEGECGEVGYGQAEDYSLEVTGGIEPEGMTSIATQPAVTEGQSLIFSFDSLLSASDAADDTVAFRVTRVLNGSLTIGGLPFDSATNNLVNNNHQAEWSAPMGGAADNVIMFAVVAVASNGGESVPAISVRTSQVQPLPVTWTGRGTKRNPYQISSAEHLHVMRYQLDAHYRLTTDINLGVAPWNTGSGWVPVGDYDVPFTGSLDGAGHAINGLFINRPDQEYVGLFGYVEGWGETESPRVSWRLLTLREWSHEQTKVKPIFP